jgi:hypothetical protein
MQEKGGIWADGEIDLIARSQPDHAREVPILIDIGNRSVKN